MTRKNLVKAIVLGTALLTGVNAFAQSKDSEVIATFEYTSHRPEKEYNGKTYKYNILSDGTICQTDKPNVKFAQTWFYDVNGNGEFDDEDLAARKSGKLVFMHPDFNKKANAESKRILENLVQSKHIATAEKAPIAKEVLSPVADHTNPFTGANGDYNGNGKTDSLENVGGYPYNERIAQKNDYAPILDEPKIQKEKSDDSFVKPIVGLTYSGIRNAFGADAGLRFGHNSDLFNLALLGSYQKGFSGESDTETTEASPAGLYGRGISETSGYQSFGFDAVGYLGKEKLKFLAGIGYHWSSEDENKTAQILRGDRVLNSNNVSDKLSDGKFRGFIGADFQVKGFRPEINIGLETNSNYTAPFVAIKTTFAPSNKYKRK